MPSRIGRVLGVVRRLIEFGREFVATIEQRATAPGFALFARPFGTADLAAILARISNGLRLAATLEARLCQRAERGQDVTSPPLRLPTAYAPRAERQSRSPDAQPEPRPDDSRLARLPTEAEIAAEVRRRPVGAVIVDICRDLGVMPGDFDRASWDELCHAIISYGGSLAGWLGKLNKLLFAFGPEDFDDPLRSEAPPGLPIPATHPP